MAVTAKNSKPILQALLEAQKIAFAPMVFQAVVAAKRLHVLDALAQNAQGLSIAEIAAQTHLSHYAVRVLVELLAQAEVLAADARRYRLTKTGDCLLFDPMTSINLDFSADVCYRAMAHLDEALREGRPAGLAELGPWTTIYPHLKELPGPAKKAWFSFDHFYSDGAFAACAQWLQENLHPSVLFDVGGNTGKFAYKCLTVMPQVRVTLVDLPEQCALAQENLKGQPGFERFAAASVNWLDPKARPAVDQKADVIWMSQFLDCFTPEQAVSILTRLREFLAPQGRVAILECLWDRQRYEAARLSLLSTSLYFTAVANGNSRFFSQGELTDIIEQAGFRIERICDHLGVSHSLFVCERV